MLPAALFVMTPFSLLAQGTAPMTEPVASNLSNIERGHHFFANNCGICHGFNAQGGEKGPNLNTGQFRHASNHADLFNTITRGIPGTVMPGSALLAKQVWTIITYLHSKVVAARATNEGDAQAGEKIFWSSDKCARCHMVNGRGGLLGPDLSRIGDGWSIGKPDVIIEMPKAFPVPAEGTVAYQYIAVASGFTEDKWVQAAEIRPGNRAVVHHIQAHAIGADSPSAKLVGGISGCRCDQPQGDRAN
jgi:mono/diheme cytochrome c family protein